MAISYSESLYEIVLNERSGIMSNSEAPNLDIEIAARKHQIFSFATLFYFEIDFLKKVMLLRKGIFQDFTCKRLGEFCITA
jgi:hypothetical protein